MYTTRPSQKTSLQLGSGYSENYFTSRKKILNDYLKDEESENLKYIKETESLVSQTKMFLKDLVGNQTDFESLNSQLLSIESSLKTDCELMKSEINTLRAAQENAKKAVAEAQEEENKEAKEFNKKIEGLKLDLESKEFTIQNMERLYIELENVIKTNIQNGNDELLTMEQFNDFLSQNLHLKEEIKQLEKKKEKLDEEYNALLKENIELRKKDENFEIEKIKEILDEFDIVEKNNKEKNNAKIKLNKLRKQYKDINEECEQLTSKIKKLVTNLKGIDINNQIYNNELNIIDNDINNIKISKLNKNKSLDNIKCNSNKKDLEENKNNEDKLIDIDKVMDKLILEKK